MHHKNVVFSILCISSWTICYGRDALGLRVTVDQRGQLHLTTCHHHAENKKKLTVFSIKRMQNFTEEKEQVDVGVVV
jgi:hypothetical protein